MGQLTFAHLREQNLPRCRRWHPAGTPPWEFDEWLLALSGEVGEALNVVKKLNRDRDGLAGNTSSRIDLIADLGSELADGVIYLDILVGWEYDTVLLGPTDFAERRARRRDADNADAMTATGTQLGNRLFRAVGRIGVFSLPSDAARVFEAIDRLADCYGIDLAAVVVAKFNATSERFGFPERLAA